jgi:hypothetical protein
MNLTKKIILALATAAAGVLHADVSATSDSSAGTLGQRYGELGFTDQNISHISNQFTSLSFGINYPITQHIDLGGSYSYGWLQNNYRQRSSVFDTGATIYTTYAGVKPFASFNLGYERDRLTETGFYPYATNYGVWGLGVGVEIPVNPTVAITPFISYQDDLQDSARSSQAYDFGAEVNYWFKQDWAAFADVGYQDVLHSRYDSSVWSIGLRQKF